MDPDGAIPDLQRRRWRPIIIGLVTVAVLAGGGVAYSKISAARAESARRERIARGLASAQRCLLGAPLAEGETVEQRFRAVYLANRTTPATPAWPTRCEPVLAALTGDLREDRSREALASTVGHLRAQLEHLGDFDLIALRGLVDAAAADGREPDPGVPVAPSPLSFLKTPAALRLDFAEAIASPTRRTVWLVDHFTRDVCRVTDRVACSYLDNLDLHLEEDQRYGAAADDAPLPIITKSSVWLVGHDQPVWRGVDPYRAFAWSEDTIDVLALAHGKLVLDRLRGKRTTRIPVATTDTIAVLDGGALLWMEREHLRALVLDPEHDPVPASAADLGEIKLAAPRVACGSPHVHALAFGTGLAVAIDGTWSPPLPIADRAWALLCREHDVVVVQQQAIQVCTATACAPARPAKLPDAGPDRSRFGAVDDTPVFLWRGAIPGDMAPRLRLGSAADRVLFDDSSHGGPDIHASQIVPMAGAALLVFRGTLAQTSVLRVDARGTVTDLAPAP